MTSRLALLVIVGLVVVTGTASAVVPYAAFVASGSRLSPVQIPLYQDHKGVWRVNDFRYSTRQFALRVQKVALDPDPSITYAISVIDFGSPTSFSFSFGTPIVPTGCPNVVGSALGGVLGDATGNGFQMTPTSGSHLQTSRVGAPLTNMGVNVGPAFAAGPSPQGLPQVFAYGLYTRGPITGPAPGPWTWMDASLSFTLSGGADTAVLAGFTGIEEVGAVVPEPASLLLLVGGLAGLAIGRRGRRI